MVLQQRRPGGIELPVMVNDGVDLLRCRRVGNRNTALAQDRDADDAVLMRNGIDRVSGIVFRA